jgi:Na+(H+)/acetate symporter ActP
MIERSLMPVLMVHEMGVLLTIYSKYKVHTSCYLVFIRLLMRNINGSMLHVTFVQVIFSR